MEMAVLETLEILLEALEILLEPLEMLLIPLQASAFQVLLQFKCKAKEL
jgi:hypothetical protein